jgi:hypothetical protein
MGEGCVETLPSSQVSEKPRVEHPTCIAASKSAISNRTWDIFPVLRRCGVIIDVTDVNVHRVLILANYTSLSLLKGAVDEGRSAVTSAVVQNGRTCAKRRKKGHEFGDNVRSLSIVANIPSGDVDNCIR